MRPLLPLLALAFSLLMPLPVFAHSGDHVIQLDEYGGIAYEKVIVQFDLAGADVGLPGSYFVGLEGDRGNYYVQTPNGWEKFQGGIPSSYQDVATLSSTLSLVLFETGTPSANGSRTVCDTLRSQTGSDKINIWIGYGTLLPEHEQRIASFHKMANPRMDPEHLRRFYVYESAGANNRTAKVLSIDCTPTMAF